jgi:ABC-type transporter Mla subunit MlaD
VTDALHRRAAELAEELRKGREELARLDARRAELRDTMLRISGALQVLEELAQDEKPARLATLAR